MAEKDNNEIPLWQKILFGILAFIVFFIIIYIITSSDSLMTLLT
jgi:hypothetical protein